MRLGKLGSVPLSHVEFRYVLSRSVALGLGSPVGFCSVMFCRVELGHGKFC